MRAPERRARVSALPLPALGRRVSRWQGRKTVTRYGRLGKGSPDGPGLGGRSQANGGGSRRRHHHRGSREGIPREVRGEKLKKSSIDRYRILFRELDRFAAGDREENHGCEAVRKKQSAPSACADPAAALLGAADLRRRRMFRRSSARRQAVSLHGENRPARLRATSGVCRRGARTHASRE